MTEVAHCHGNMLRSCMLSPLMQHKHGKGKEKTNMLTSTPIDPAACAGTVSLILGLVLSCRGIEQSIPMNTSNCGQEEWCIGRLGSRLHWFAACLHAQAMHSTRILSLNHASRRLPRTQQVQLLSDRNNQAFLFSEEDCSAVGLVVCAERHRHKSLMWHGQREEVYGYIFACQHDEVWVNAGC